MQISSAAPQNHSAHHLQGLAKDTASQRGSRAGNELTPEEANQVEELKKRDREVRRHEQAHKATAGQYAQGAPTFDYQTGPDGRRYAVGGEVQIDTSKVHGDPAATIRKAQIIKRAALAPQDPSSQDRRVAAEATQMEQEARQELAKLRAEEPTYAQNGARNRHLPEPSAVDIFV